MMRMIVRMKNACVLTDRGSSAIGGESADVHSRVACVLTAIAGEPADV